MKFVISQYLLDCKEPKYIWGNLKRNISWFYKLNSSFFIWETINLWLQSLDENVVAESNVVPVVARRKRQAAAAVPDAKDEEYEDDDQSPAATGGQYIIYHCYNKAISIIWVNKIPLILFRGQKVVRYVT